MSTPQQIITEAIKAYCVDNDCSDIRFWESEMADAVWAALSKAGKVSTVDIGAGLTTVIAIPMSVSVTRDQLANVLYAHDEPEEDSSGPNRLSPFGI